MLAANGLKARVGGYGSPGGAYYGAYANAGGTLVTSDAAQVGDLVQITYGPSKNSDYPPTDTSKPARHLHTAIIVGMTSTAGTYILRDSNWNGDGKVFQHTLNPVAWAAQTGSTAYFWRFGTATSGSPAPRLGKADLVMANAAAGTYDVALSTGSGFGAPGTGHWLSGWSTSPSWTGLADVNGDGKADLVMANAAAGTYDVA
ncbi:FG-GAP repeat domain-containing protein, partial [uncultured Jatrophihabitans sp.]|uniref:FG-GAP repeat domain-containing protein n=1 Tax=uncultured Jatrophihabitans sp. TaxID=1610747 RepID=UPI0035CB9297